MSEQQIFNVPQDIVILLEIVPEDEQDADIADVEEVSREIVDYLRNSGYTVEPAYSGTKGNPAFEIVVHIYQFIHDNKEWITAMLSTSSVALQYLMKERDRRTEKEKSQRSPLEITLYLNGKAVPSDIESATEAAEQNQVDQLEKSKREKLHSTPKIHVRVPRKKRHHRP